MSIASELVQLNTTKANIKTAIESKAPSISPTDELGQWPKAISSIVELKGEMKTVNPSTSLQIITPSSGKNGITRISITRVDHTIDSDIQPYNIKDGVNILGVTGNVVELKGETKTVTPTTTQQTITPSSGKNAMTAVVVDAVTSGIDNNIQPQNIVAGVSILGVNGTASSSGGITPVGNINITNTNQTDVTNYATAQVVDSNLVAENVKKNVSILGVIGSYEGSGGGGSSTNYLMAFIPEHLGTHDGTKVSNYVYEGVTTASWDSGAYSYMILQAVMSDGSIINTGQVGSYSINLNGRTLAIQDFYTGCVLKETKILLSDNTEKNIEDITYDDELLVWDFDNSCLSKAKPIWIKKSETNDYWFLNKYKSGKVLKTTGKSATGWGHRTFDINKNKFIYTTESVSDNIFTLDGIDAHMSCERIEEPCEYYNIITERHFNLFANRILTSCSLNNLYPIKDMKYVKDNRTLRNISDYDNIPQEWFDGLRLAENNTNIDELNKYVAKLINKKV